MTRNIPTANHSRQRLFRAALGLSGKTLTQWAEEHDVTRQHLGHVLAGRRESRSLTEAVDAYIAKHLVSRTTLVA